MTDQRFCLHCGKPLVRPPHTSDFKWAKRRFCSKSCAGKRRVIQRFKPRSLHSDRLDFIDEDRLL